MATPYHSTRLVEFHDTDMAGIMHFSAFFQYMEMAEHEFFRSLGYSIFSTIGGEHVSFPRVAASCEYHSPAKCEDELDIEVRVERVGEKSITYAFRFRLQDRDVATGSMTCVCCKVEPGMAPKSTAIPPELSHRLQEYIA